MVTLNQIKYKLIDFFKKHKQINHVSYSESFDFSAERNLSYPAVNIEYMQSSMQGKKMIHSFNIVIGDLIDADNGRTDDEIYSDALQITEDFFTYLNEDYSFELSKNSSIQKFADSNGDRVSGVTFTVSLIAMRHQNKCIIPFT